jgi:alpha-L-rhamnosidase
MSAVTLTHLTVEHLVEPLGLATLEPRFGWVLDAAAVRGVRQTAYELEVYREEEDQPSWTTGRVVSTQSVLVEYAGPELLSGIRYAWRVRVWCEAEERREAVSAWAASWFETSLVDPATWRAGWVEPAQATVVNDGATSFGDIFGYRSTTPPEERLHPAQYLRQNFELAERPVRGRLYATARGVYQPELNGRPVGDQVLAPGYSSYDKEIAFQTYDVTDLLEPGANVIGVVLGDGWYAGRISILGRSTQYGDRLQASWQLLATYADGRTDTVVSDDTVRSTTGPIRYSDLFVGERHDGRLDIGAWSTPGYDDTAWTPVTTVDGGDTTLVPFVGEPVRRVLELPIATVLRTPKGETVVDVGQVIAGRVRLRVTGPEGTEVTLEHSETLDAEGNYFDNIVGPNKDQTDVYVLAGHPEGETWEPLFTFHGFRYVRVTGWPGELAADALTAVVIASDLPLTGDFACSDRALTQLHRNTMWSQRANFLAVPTDCPQRERAGWTGDIQVFAPTAATNMGVAPFLSRWLDNLRADQHADGLVPIIVPMPPALQQLFDALTPDYRGMDRDFLEIQAAAGWSDAVLMVPWTLYQRYGDRRVLEDNHAAMQEWVAFQTRGAQEKLPRRLTGVELSEEQRRRQSLLWSGEPNFGDWLTPSTLRDAEHHEQAMMVAPHVTGELVGAMFGAESLRLLGEIAAVLGRHDDAAEYALRAKEVREAFMAEYVGPDGRLPVDMQGVYVLVLTFGLVPEDRHSVVVDRLVDLVHAADDHLDTGFLSVPYLLDVLWDTGHRELAWRLLRQDTVPSWLYEVRMGATTIWESWDSVAPDGSVGPTSLNHYAFGCVDDWLYRRVAGLQAASPGYAEAIIAPHLDSGLDWVAAHHDTPYGRLAVAWQARDGAVDLTVTVPANTSATLRLPPRWAESSGERGGIPLTSGITSFVLSTTTEVYA